MCIRDRLTRCYVDVKCVSWRNSWGEPETSENNNFSRPPSNDPDFIFNSGFVNNISSYVLQILFCFLLNKNFRLWWNVFSGLMVTICVSSHWRRQTFYWELLNDCEKVMKSWKYRRVPRVLSIHNVVPTLNMGAAYAGTYVTCTLANHTDSCK